MRRCRLLLADDHDVVLTGVRQLLDRPGFEIVGTVADGIALLRAAADLRPDVVVTDVTMPLLNGIEAARQIRKTDGQVKFIFLSMHPDIGYATEALALGRTGYVLKSSAAEELPLALRDVLSGRTYIARAIRESVTNAMHASAHNGEACQGLTFRQLQVLQMLAEGCSVKEIAFSLKISMKTVEYHKFHIREKLGVHSVAELARYAAKSGLVA